MEKTVQVSIRLTLGRLSKIQGQFEEALAQFNPTFDRIVAEDIDAGGWSGSYSPTLAKYTASSENQQMLSPSSDPNSTA